MQRSDIGLSPPKEKREKIYVRYDCILQMFIIRTNQNPLQPAVSLIDLLSLVQKENLSIDNLEPLILSMEGIFSESEIKFLRKHYETGIYV